MHFHNSNMPSKLIVSFSILLRSYIKDRTPCSVIPIVALIHFYYQHPLPVRQNIVYFKQNTNGVTMLFKYIFLKFSPLCEVPVFWRHYWTCIKVVRLRVFVVCGNWFITLQPSIALLRNRPRAFFGCCLFL